MEQGYLEYFYKYPFQNGFLIFTIGALFLLTIYHFVLFFQQKDKIYLLYSGYTFFVILSQLRHLEEGFIFHLIAPIKDIALFPIVSTEIYYVIYVLFAIKFLNIETHYPKWSKYITRALKLIMIYCLVIIVVHLFNRSDKLLMNGYFVFTILMSVLGIFSYIPFFKVRSPLKYYIILGSFFLFSFSVVSLMIYFEQIEQNLPIEPSYSILYVGFLLENTLFSLGLGHKQKLILDERNRSQQMLITQLKENEKLQIKVQNQLKENVKAMEIKAEAERLKGFQNQYDKELAELKLLALRSQMNPHFIFNSLNSIKRYIIDNDKEKAVYYMNKFAKLIRRILASTMEKESSLTDELETMELYMNIENIRFNNTIDFRVDCQKGIALNSIKIPSLLLQPFIENAIWHGLSLKRKDKLLSIELSKLGRSTIRINIIDNGIGLHKSKQIKERKIHKNKSLGITLSRERLEHFSKKFKGHGIISIMDLNELTNKGTGTQVQIDLPIK
ncbi:sensor histidine kinase [Maribacter sp. 4G9]|uniref:sensor histidine kinase n=1 Tax=Maribacter sp. 4G9 TaxID=1889777 RepID=UPI000C150FA2|nr:histidine kinase [Maribacter sp. 4G9]PIB30439.1 hypothetical protein BFP75_02575 [Maribacter sp. 4G9]